MRFIALLPLLCSLTALILTLLCLVSALFFIKMCREDCANRPQHGINEYFS